jgi:hypothetical protein
MPSDIFERQNRSDDLKDQNRKVLLIIFAVIALLMVVSVITILVKN